MHRLSTLLRLPTVLTAACALAACASLAPSPEPSVERIPTPAAGRTAYEEANIANVSAFYDAAFNAKNFTRARFYMGDAYVEHSPTKADGHAGLEAYVNALRTDAPVARRSIEGAYADGDFVILHVRSDQPPGTPGQAIVDIFRLDANGKIVEHWDITQAIPPPEEALNANGMFYTVTPAEPTPQTPEQEAENERIAYEFYDRALNQKDFAAARELMGDVYIQHNLRAVDGPEGLEAHVAMIAETFPENRGHLQRSFVDGDRVFFHFNTKRTPDQPGMAVMDMFRVADGKVVEHWDVIQPVPETSMNGNGMF